MKKQLVTIMLVIVMFALIFPTIILATEEENNEVEEETTLIEESSNEEEDAENPDESNHIEENAESGGSVDKLSAELSAGLSQRTNFSNAKFELKKDGVSDAIIEVSGVQPLSNHSYYLFIQPNNTKPTYNSSNQIPLIYDTESKKFIAKTNVDKYVELNQNLYAFVYEMASFSENDFVTDGIKLERYAEPKYNEAFFATHLTNSTDQIVTKFTHSSYNSRKLTIKLGKITDTNILRKIKNNDVSGMADLMNYAKSASASVNETITVNNNYSLEYATTNGTKKVTFSNLADKEYYYLYVTVDTENGKYIPQEAVTLAISSKYENGSWYMFFYGENDFKWTDLGSTTTTTETKGETKDNSTANSTLPKTGKGLIIVTAIIVLIGSKYDGI